MSREKEIYGVCVRERKRGRERERERDREIVSSESVWTATENRNT